MSRSPNRKRSAQAVRKAPTLAPAARQDEPVAKISGVLPRSVAGLSPAGAQVVRRLQVIELERRDAEARLEREIIKARQHGVSWAAIGWSVGTTGEAARQRWARKVPS